MAALTREARARRYLQASMNAGYSNLPAERREAYEGQMRGHERAYPRVREHALAGTDQDFDAPLTAGEREHQQHLRDQHGVQGSDVKRIRDEMRSRGAPPKPRARASSSSGRSSSPRSTVRRAATGGTGAIAAATSGHGSVFMQLLGWTLALSLIYLLVAGKGVSAVGGIVSAVTGGVRAFIAPVDPVAKLESSLGAAPVTTLPEGTVASGVSGSAPVGSSTVTLTPTGQLHGGASAPAPSSIGVPSSAPADKWGVPASLLRAIPGLRRSDSAEISAGHLTVGQARRREEALIPRSKYPAFYAGR